MTREWFGEVGEKWKNPPGPLSKGVTIEKDCDLLKNAQIPTIKLIFLTFFLAYIIFLLYLCTKFQTYYYK